MIPEIFCFRLKRAIPGRMAILIEQFEMKENEPVFFLFPLFIPPEERGVCFNGDQEILLGKGRNFKSDVEG